MRKLVITASIFTLATVFSFANTTHEALQNQVSRAAALAAANPPQQPKISDAAILKIVKNKYGCNYKFTDGHSRLKPDDWTYPSLKFQRTSDGFIAKSGALRLECELGLDGFYILYGSQRTKNLTVADKNGNSVNNQQLLNNYRSRNLNKFLTK